MNLRPTSSGQGEEESAREEGKPAMPSNSQASQSPQPMYQASAMQQGMPQQGTPQQGTPQQQGVPHQAFQTQTTSQPALQYPVTPQAVAQQTMQQPVTPQPMGQGTPQQTMTYPQAQSTMQIPLEAQQQFAAQKPFDYFDLDEALPIAPIEGLAAGSVKPAQPYSLSGKGAKGKKSKKDRIINIAIGVFVVVAVVEIAFLGYMFATGSLTFPGMGEDADAEAESPAQTTMLSGSVEKVSDTALSATSDSSAAQASSSSAVQESSSSAAQTQAQAQGSSDAASASDSAAASADDGVQAKTQSVEPPKDLDFTMVSANDTDRSFFVMPSSSKVQISTSQLANYSNVDLCIARNEIFARHGLIFDNTDLQRYFDEQQWYCPMFTRQDMPGYEGLLSDIERENVKIIQEEEQKRKSPFIDDKNTYLKFGGSES